MRLCISVRSRVQRGFLHRSVAKSAFLSAYRRVAWRGREPVCSYREDQLLGAQSVVILLWRTVKILFALRSRLGGKS